MEEFFNFITPFINSIGFPAACCGVMMWYINKQSERHKQEVHEQTEEHRKEITALQNSLDRNTDVLEKILLKGVNNE